MNTMVNSKRVFLVLPHTPVGYVEILGRRGDVKLDKLEHDSPAEVGDAHPRIGPRLPDRLDAATSWRGTTTPAPTFCGKRRTS